MLGLNHVLFYVHRNTEKTEKKVKSLEEEIVENKKHLEELDRTFKRLEEDATTVLTAFRAAQVRHHASRGPSVVLDTKTE